MPIDIGTHVIRTAIVGLGNCASSLIEGLQYYRQHPECDDGLLFPSLCGYTIREIDVIAAFDISGRKVDLPISEAIYQAPNNFVRIPGVRVQNNTRVFRGPTLDGNPEHLAQLVPESTEPPCDVASTLRELGADLLVNFLPTGSSEATKFYAEAALDAGCGFVNCIPTVLAQDSEIVDRFVRKRQTLFGDDIKSQIGTTILHRALLRLLHSRGARIFQSSQVNLGGNTDFANFVHRAETKLVSKRKSLARYVDDAISHVGHHYDITKGNSKHAFIDIKARVFGGSQVSFRMRMESDDKPNCAGSVIDLIRLAKGAKDKGIGGYIPEACAFYMKSPPEDMEDHEALDMLQSNWVCDGVSKQENLSEEHFKPGHNESVSRV